MKCYFIHFISLQILDIDHWYAPPRFLIGSFTRFGIQSTNFVHVPSISSSWYQTWSMDSISFILVVHSLRRKRALMIAYKRSMKFKSGPWSIREQSSQVSDHACFNHVYNYLKSSCSPLGVESQRLRRRAAPDHCIFLGDSQSDRCGMDKAFRHCWRTSHVDCAGLAHKKNDFHQRITLFSSRHVQFLYFFVHWLYEHMHPVRFQCSFTGLLATRPTSMSHLRTTLELHQCWLDLSAIHRWSFWVLRADVVWMCCAKQFLNIRTNWAWICGLFYK